MDKESNIEHDGIVKSISGDKVTIEILSKSACSDCHAKGLCSASDQKKKEVEVALTPGFAFAVGERVTVTGKESIGILAVILAYVAPLLLMVAAVIVCTLLGLSQGAAGLSAIGILVPYFLVLYAMRKKLHKTFIFRIKNQ